MNRPPPPSSSRSRAAIFDLDDTLLDGDSDFLWGEYLCDNGIVDAAGFRAANTRFLEDYKRGELDIARYHAFQLAPMMRYSLEQLEAWRAQYIETMIAPRVLRAGREAIQAHQRDGHAVVIATATHRFITGPIAALFGVETLLAADIEVANGRCTGRMATPPCQGEGKRTYVENWADGVGADLDASWFYSDSRNDLPLLERVGNPVAVNPDEVLAARAACQGWPIVDWRPAR